MRKLWRAGRTVREVALANRVRDREQIHSLPRLEGRSRLGDRTKRRRLREVVVLSGEDDAGELGDEHRLELERGAAGHELEGAPDYLHQETECLACYATLKGPDSHSPSLPSTLRAVEALDLRLLSDVEWRASRSPAD
jgi:hypothetical protein